MKFLYTSQSEFLAVMTQGRSHEYTTWPLRDQGDGQFYLFNQMFGPVDAELLYCIIRHTKPSRVIEVGSGWSTVLINKALHANHLANSQGGELTTIDPSVDVGVKKLPDIIWIEQRAEDVVDDLYLSLEPGDVLFWDGSHRGGPGSDVEHLIDRVLEMLSPGVLVHVHDIFLPDGYPMSFIERGYDEQDYLAVFLNSHLEWKILFGAHWFSKNHADELKKAFPSWDGSRGAGSFWMMKEKE